MPISGGTSAWVDPCTAHQGMMPGGFMPNFMLDVLKRNAALAEDELQEQTREAAYKALKEIQDPLERARAVEEKMKVMGVAGGKAPDVTETGNLEAISTAKGCDMPTNCDELLPDISLARVIKWAVVVCVVLALGTKVWEKLGPALTNQLGKAIGGSTPPAA